MYKSVELSIENPKVRFNKSLESVVTKKNVEVNNSNSKEKVKIKSSFPIKFPIKILKNSILITNQQDINNDSKIIKQSELEEKRIYNIDKRNFNNATSIIPSIKELKSIIKIDSSKSSTILKSELPNIKNYSKNYTKSKNDKINNNVFKIQSYIDTSNSNIKFHQSMPEDKTKNITCEDDTQIIQIINTSKKPSHIQIIKKNANICDINCTKSKFNEKNKEKEKHVYHKINKIAERDKSNYSKFVKSNKVKNEFITFTSTKILKNNVLQLPDNIFNKKSIKLKKKKQYMPYAKFKIISTNNKSMEQLLKTNLKKSTIFHTKGKHSISVHPTILSKNDNVNTNNFIEDSKGRNTSINLLSYPEYNSSICIIKKMKEIQTEKLINNTEHLSLMDKHFSNGKISAALDFTPYESVYKDLINLSMDDKPSFRFIRNKIPEPREKDIIPKLSDFYNPKYTNQYFIIMRPTSSNSINVNTLNAFSISNKIYIWKHSMNNNF